MSRSQRERMKAGDWYACVDPELEALRAKARDAAFEHNTTPPSQRGDIAPALARLFGAIAAGVRVEAPFHCAYGFNIDLGEQVFINAGAVFLDTAPLIIGPRTLIGPGVHIYCAEHHLDPVQRIAGLEIAKPVSIGSDVWIGGGAIILAGVTIGDRAIVGAGAVVTKSVAPDAIVVGNPARPLER
ncbi:MAG TPA: sugar O-acetyltransferase [Mesorhizobium sp.]